MNTLLRDRRTCAAFIGESQYRTMLAASRGEEGEFFKSKFHAIALRVLNMPRTYEQGGLGDKAVAHLHYFTAGADWYITELDRDDDGAGQIQAFGSANLGYGAELGYISIHELLQAGAELDLHFEPTPLNQIEKAHA